MITSYGAKVEPTFAPLRISGDVFQRAFSIDSQLRPSAVNALGTANVMSRGFWGSGYWILELEIIPRGFCLKFRM